MMIVLPSHRRRHFYAICLVILLSFLLIPYPVQAENYRENMQMGLSAYDKGDYQTALKHFTDAQLEDPGDAELLYNLGSTYYKIEDYDAAIHSFQEALKSPDESLRQKTYYNLGNTHFRKQVLDESLKHYQKALEIDSNDTQARQNIEYVKKIKAQQQQKPSGDQESKDDPKEGEDKEKGDSQSDENPQKKDGEKQPQSDEKNEADRENPPEDKSSSSYGKEMDEDQQRKPAEAGASKESQDEKEPKEDESGRAQTQPGETGDREERKKQAERALNRLKDQPGRATMPRYREKPVDKDW